MNAVSKSKQELQREIDELKVRLAESEVALEAIRTGAIDALIVTRDITERKRAEEALRESEEQYRTRFNSLIEGFCVIEMIFDKAGKAIDYRFLEVNETFEKQTGLRDALGKSMRDLAPDHEEHWFKTYGEIAVTGQAAHFVNEARALNRWYDVRAFKIGGPESRKVGICFNDISEQKKIEEALRESEERYRHLVKQAPAGIYEIDFTTGRFLEVNDAMCLILGYSRDELLAMTAADILDDEGKARFRERIQRAQAGDQPGESVEYRVRAKNGHMIWGLLTTRFHWQEGRIERATVIAHDVTRRKEAEEALRESEANYKELVENANTIILRMDNRGILNFVNEYALRFFGYAPAEIFGKNVNILIPRVESFTGRNLGEMSKSILKNPDDFVENINENIRKNGERVWISWRNKGIKDSHGNLVGNLAIGLDITERKRAEEALRESEARFRTIAEALPALISLSRTEDSTIVYTNNAYNDAFGFKGEDIIGRKGPDVYFDEADRRKMLELIGKQGFVDGYLIKAKKNDGTPLWLSSSVRPIMYEGKPAILGASIDITERKRAEAELIAANRELSMFNQVMIGREIRMVELKKEINALLKELGRPAVYDPGSTAG